MGGFMSKKIIYYTQRYRPHYEAISKEISLLANHFKKNYTVNIHDLHLDGIFKFKFNRRICSYHFIFYPFLMLFRRILSYGDKINHIYTSLGDLPYLNTINLNNSILTAAASCHLAKVRRRIRKLKRLKAIIVETKLHRDWLLGLRISPQKVNLIYPPVDLNQFGYKKAVGRFKILYASCPIKKSDFSKRGIYLLLQTAKVNPKIEFHFAWRKGAYLEMVNLVKDLKLNNVVIHNEINKNMSAFLDKIHATIIPYTKFDAHLKLMPNSAIESLASGKPVLISNRTELASMIQEQDSGVVFEPSVDELGRALGDLRENYAKYQKNCRKTAQQFSEEKFLEKYRRIYDQFDQ